MLKSKFIIIVLVTPLIILLMLIFTIPSLAKDPEYIEIQNGFTLDQRQRGQYIQPGSEIRQLENGITEIYGPDGILKMRADDTNSQVIHTPNGRNITANHNYLIPSGSSAFPPSFAAAG
jgi:hypothetical protein